MVRKIKIAVFIVLFMILALLSLLKKGNVEVNLLKTLLPETVANYSDIVAIANKNSSIVKVVFEADSEDGLLNAIDAFMEEIDENSFEINKFKGSKLLNIYLSNPQNFLSHKTKELLKNKKYDEVYSNSIKMLYGPNIQLSDVSKDPYLFVDDFISDNETISFKNNYQNNKYYENISLKIKTSDGLSPDLSNKKIKELIKLQKKLSEKGNKIYLAGTPLHSYHTSVKSIVLINIICILSIFLILFIIYRCFNTLKPALPVILSLSFGMLSGYCATRYWFSDFQIITTVFSSALLGIGIDYSYHSFFGSKTDKFFAKKLTYSFITTAIPFILLYFTSIELLRQISVFTIFGLFGIYFTVLFIYPEFKNISPEKTIEIKNSFCKILLIVMVVLSGLGFFRFRFNDSLSSLYSPSLKLKKAETLYNQISSENKENTKLVIVKGENIKNIIEKEEEITTALNKENSEYMALSKLFPSEKTQKENYELVKNLYLNNLDKFRDILSPAQINTLKSAKFSPVKFNLDDFSFVNAFLIDKNTSLIYVFGNNRINISDKNVSTVDFKADIESVLKKYRKMLLVILPSVLVILFILLSILYDFKKAVKMLIAPLLGIFASVGLNCLIIGEINLFNIIAIFLLIGFTTDYSVFRDNNSEVKVENAVFFSCITTSFSFLMLSLCGFKLISSISLILFFGIITSYIAGKLISSK